ncbi:MAG: glycosyltransferase, partial [Flammeovirgaceae bacterium]|nr:glycosyltransferase [Flammeovirgaceae bacterium]MDW8287241.1 glycosyltransferase [Flammeovirgaceae bacterium]
MLYVLLILYWLSIFFIFLFSIGQLYLVYVYQKNKHVVTTTAKRQLPEELPIVTVQLPIYNEKYVVERLLDSISRLEYPKDKLDIQLLDDSTDETTELARRKIASILQEKGIAITHLHRTHRKGFKAGALQEGLIRAKGDFIAIFDADFLPPSDFLLKTIPLFDSPDIGAVQTRWGHLNDRYSLFTRLQSFGLDAHFCIEQKGRNLAGFFINFNGTAGIWRKACILDADGWHDDTLTEDLDLSYRAQLNGWKFRYLEEVVSPAELPVYVVDIKNQQFRWNKGGAQTAKKHLARLWKAPFPWKVKFYATLHLLNSTVFLALTIATFISVILLFFQTHLTEYFYSTISLFWIGIFSIAIFYFYATKVAHPQKYISIFF